MSTPVDNAYFFGFIGVASALVFASTLPNRCRSWCCLWKRQGRCRYLLHGCAQARANHEVGGSRGHGRYLGYLRHDRGSHHCAEEYDMSDAVPSNPANYSYYQGYAHLASGLCCGFSSLVPTIVISGGRAIHRNRGRRRCTCKRSARQDIRGNDSDSDLRRSTGAVRSDRVTDPLVVVINVRMSEASLDMKKDVTTDVTNKIN
jgi:hypothetical protein